MIELQRMNYEIDIRKVLPTIRVPALVLHSPKDRAVNFSLGRYLARSIPGAKLVELTGGDHVPWGDCLDQICDEIEVFLTGIRREREADRVLATVLFTDIVGSTEKAVALGDHRWRELLERHHAIVRGELARFRGREIGTAGDGFLATFDGPARGVRCALAIGAAVRSLGLEVRAGLHTGECELIGDNVSGIAVHIGARVASSASASEVLVSSTIKDLVAGSGISFEDRGLHPLKGVPEAWHLYKVVAA
jgi:class 3 adenylate cyclase